MIRSYLEPCRLGRRLKNMIRSEPTLRVAPAQPRTRRTGRPTLAGILWQIGAILILVGGILPASLLLGVGAGFETRQLILPRVSIAGLDLSGMDREQAGNALNLIWNVNHHLTLTGAGQSWQISPVDLGLFLDPTATAQGAYRAGRASLWAELEQILRQPSREISPVIGFRADLARAELERRAQTLDVAPQEAALTFANGKWSAIPAKTGLALDLDATLAPIVADPAGFFFGGQVLLVLRPVPPQTADLDPVAAKLQASVNKPLKIQVYDPIQDETLDWTVPPEALATWLVVADPAALNPKITLDPERLPAYLDGKQAALAPLRTLQPYQLPADPTRFWLQGQTLDLMTRNLPTTYPVVVGDTLYQIARKVEVPYWMILKANPGVTDASLRKGLSLNIPSKSDSLPLPVVMGKRIVVSISRQHLWTYESGKLRKEYVISTGMSDSPTMPGVYQVQSHIENAYASNWDLWMPNFMGIYEAVPGFWNGIHGLPIMSNGLRLWGNVLGSPVTYGCILMDLKDSQELYDWAQEGVVVEIDS